VFLRSCEVATAQKHEIDNGKTSLLRSGYAALGFLKILLQIEDN